MLIGAYKSHDQPGSAISNVRWDGKPEIIVKILYFSGIAENNEDLLDINFPICKLYENPWRMTRRYRNCLWKIA